MAEISCKVADTVTTPVPTPAQTDSVLDTDSVTMPVRLCSLPPLNAIANQLLTLSANPNIELRELSKVMECDPAFAADVLFLANSSLFGFPSRIVALRHAIAVLGLDRIKTLAVTVAMRSYLGKGGPLVRQCWRHSAACAVIAERICSIFQITPETAYSVGLLHDVGRLGLLKSYSVEYSPVLNSNFKDVDHVLRAERAVLNVDHGLAGAWLVKNWGLPVGFATTCQHHHDELSVNDSELLLTAKVACRLADILGFSAVKYDPAPTYEQLIESLPITVNRDRFPTAEELTEKVEAKLKSFV